MLSSKMLLAAEVLASVPAVQASHAAVYSVGTFSDAACTVPTADTKEAHAYELHQVDTDKHCYAHKGYSLKLVCDHDDTVKVDHWYDVSGNGGACTGETLGQPLLEDVPWELAVGFLKGECTWSSGHGIYGKLSAALPLDGYPTCDLTGASIRRLTSNSSNSSQGNQTTVNNGANGVNNDNDGSNTGPAIVAPTTPPTASNNTTGENITNTTGDTEGSTESLNTAVLGAASSLRVATAAAAAAAVVVFTNIVV